MHSIAFSTYGKPSELKKTSVAYPHGFDPSNNIVIKVHAAAVNPVDKALLSGDIDKQHTVVLDVFDGEIVFRKPIEAEELVAVS